MKHVLKIRGDLSLFSFGIIPVPGLYESIFFKININMERSKRSEAK
jgi:hypothetical protein